MYLSLLLTLALAAPPALLTSELAMSFGGEQLPSGGCAAAVVPAPGVPGKYSLRMVFRFDRYQDADWLDVTSQPAPPLSLPEVFSLPIRAEQESGSLVLKMVDPDNPGGNHAAHEQALLVNGQPLPAKQWVTLSIRLPAEAKLRDQIAPVQFYLPCFDRRVPLDTDIVFYVGQFDYQPPARPAWPPRATTSSSGVPVTLDPLRPGTMWVPAGGSDNQTGHLARLTGDEAVFDADAGGWNEFLHSDPRKLRLDAGATYRLQFEYEVLREPSGGDSAMFYFLVRAAGTIQHDVGWLRWVEPAGTKGCRVVTFTTGELPDYYVIWGVRHHGAIRLFNLRLERLPKG